MNHDKNLVKLVRELRDLRNMLNRVQENEEIAFHKLRVYCNIHDEHGDRDVAIDEALKRLGQAVLDNEEQ